MNTKRIIMVIAMAAFFVIGIPGHSWASGNWQQQDSGWTYQNDDGTIPKNSWVLDQGQWYYLDENGNMQKGWVFSDKKWYYLSESGSMLRSTTQSINGVL